MSIEFLKPVNNALIEAINNRPSQIIGKKILMHSSAHGLPDLESVKVVLFSVKEYRESVHELEPYKVDEFRKELYTLFPGNWHFKYADLGDLIIGKNASDTHKALKIICAELRELNIISIVIGGSHELNYSIYSSYEKTNKWVTIANVDRCFDLSYEDELISTKSFLSKIINEEKCNLYNYVTLGYQSYYVAQEEIDLMEGMFFDYKRLGSLNKSKIQQIEPYLRDSNIISLDMKCLKGTIDGTFSMGIPNGFDGQEVCAISKYAGMSEKIAHFGVFDMPNNAMFHKLLAQVIWYFFEGYQSRYNEYPTPKNKNFQKHIVNVQGIQMEFYKSTESHRWWVELNTNFDCNNNNIKNSALLSCNQIDFLEANEGFFPERWMKAVKRT